MKMKKGLPSGKPFPVFSRCPIPKTRFPARQRVIWYFLTTSRIAASCCSLISKV